MQTTGRCGAVRFTLCSVLFSRVQPSHVVSPVIVINSKCVALFRACLPYTFVLCGGLLQLTELVYTHMGKSLSLSLPLSVWLCVCTALLGMILARSLVTVVTFEKPSVHCKRRQAQNECYV